MAQGRSFAWIHFSWSVARTRSTAALVRYRHRGGEGQELWSYFRKCAIQGLRTPWSVQFFFLGGEIRCSLQPFSSWKKSLRGCFKPEDCVTLALQTVRWFYGRSANQAPRSRNHKQNLWGFLVLESSPKKL